MSYSIGMLVTRLTMSPLPGASSRMRSATARHHMIVDVDLALAHDGPPNQGSSLLLLEQLLKPGPAGIVITLQGRGFEREASRTDHQARLEHEGEGVRDFLRLQFGGRSSLEGGVVGAVRGHAIVQRRAARDKAFRLGVVDAVHETHELVHVVAVKPGR